MVDYSLIVKETIYSRFIDFLNIKLSCQNIWHKTLFILAALKQMLDKYWVAVMSKH